MSVITEEKVTEKRPMTEKAVRLLRALPLLHRLFPLYLVLTVLSGTLPNLFRWYSGLYTKCISDGSCEPALSSFPVSGWGLFLLAFLTWSIKSAASLIISVGGKLASLELLGEVLKGLGRVRVTFYDENPSGRIRKRLVGDYSEIRQFALQDIGGLFHSAGEMGAALVLVSFVSPFAALTVIPVAIGTIALQRRLLPGVSSALAERALRVSALAPALDDLIEGRSTFTLYGKEHSARRHVAKAYSALFQASAVVTERMAWSRFSLCLFSDSYTAFVILVIGLACTNNSLSYVTGGVVLSAVSQLSFYCRWIGMISSHLEGDFVSSERLLEYTSLPIEESAEGNLTRQDPVEYHKGISFINFTASYREDTPIILHEVSCHIPWGKKTTLIGRSGCGKSTLIQALLRMVYVREGDILMDGRSIYNSSPAIHRETFSVVPQHPYLFKGTIGSNLDRAGNYSEEEALAALTKVGLSHSLEFPIDDGGMNLSMGERQLLSLARAVLRKRPVLIMDEPTSLVDVETDRRIQMVLRKEFAHATVITIAHRVETIEDYDLAILIDEGRILNVGHPTAIREEAQALRQVA